MDKTDMTECKVLMSHLLKAGQTLRSQWHDGHLNTRHLKIRVTSGYIQFQALKNNNKLLFNLIKHGSTARLTLPSENTIQLPGRCFWRCDSTGTMEQIKEFINSQNPHWWSTSEHSCRLNLWPVLDKHCGQEEWTATWSGEENLMLSF